MNAPHGRIAAILASALIAGASAAAAQQSSSLPAPAPTAATPAAAADRDPAPREERERTRGRRASRERIEAEEITGNAASHSDVYSLVSSLRPSWLRVRKSSMMLSEEVRVYRDGVPMGGPAALRQVPTHSVGRVEHLDGSQATTRFGTGHGSGAILVFTR